MLPYTDNVLLLADDQALLKSLYRSNKGVCLRACFQSDAYVTRLREEFDHELMSEQRFMSCICSARIARAACCKMQIQTWRQLQQGIMVSIS